MAARGAALTTTELSPRLLVMTLGGDDPLTSYGANCVALLGSAGTLVVDPLIAPAHARLVAAELERRGARPVTDVVATHHHTDHALGAGWFGARGAVVAVQARCAERMRAEHPALVRARRADPRLAALFADAEAHEPAVAFASGWRVDLGDVAAEARHLGPGHTPGDCVVLFPSEDAVACGDLVVAGWHHNYEDADLQALPAALERLRACGARRLVPGHGAPGGPELVDEQARYHAEVERLVRAATSDEGARAALRERFPGRPLENAIESAVARLRR
ncbi:MAG TPA: MBL fold metallo-hydrolase [Anaeromyxobacteraceae bacterium]|nr:MBL fold metallo-hydrolase [Anaeromyxobacteraceae bacterium]